MNLDSLKEQVSNLTLYDLKAGVRKVQNGRNPCIAMSDQQARELMRLCTAVMNYTEMEAKVGDITYKMLQIFELTC